MLDPEQRFCICPAGKRLYRNGANVRIRANTGVQFRSAKRDCAQCALRGYCMRNPAESETRQVVFVVGRRDPTESQTARMRRKIDSDEGRYRYSRRLGIVEPAFANVTRPSVRAERPSALLPGALVAVVLGAAQRERWAS